jgi:hypothetical protein
MKTARDQHEALCVEMLLTGHGLGVDAEPMLGGRGRMGAAKRIRSN